MSLAEMTSRQRAGARVNGSRTARIFVNLAALRRGGGLTHIAGFLPELVGMRAKDHFSAVVPEETAGVVASWGVSVSAHNTPPRSPRLRLQLDQVTSRRSARQSDIILSPLNHGPVRAPAPHILWACNALYFERASGLSDHINKTFARAAMRWADLVIYPSAAARAAAERSGVAAPGLIVRHPLRVTAPAPPDRWRVGGSRPLRVLVPSTNQAHKNLTLLKRLSRVLHARGVDHQVHVSADLPVDLSSDHISGGSSYSQGEMARLCERYDVVLVPSLTESYSYPLMEFERLGFPLAVSDIPTHRELSGTAHLFDPASPHGAADALLAAVADGPSSPPAVEDDWRFRSPASYASAVSLEIDRLLSEGQA